MTNNISNEKSIRDSYDEWHTRHETDPVADAPWYRMVKAAVRPDLDLAGKRVLEIGCGLGGFAAWIAAHHPHPATLVAADFSPTAVRKAEQFAVARGITGIEWVVADIQNLAGFREEFDTVFSCETVEHVPDPALAVRELARVLRPGGRLYLTTPNYLNTMGLYRGYCWVRGRPFDEGGQPLCNLTMSPRTRRWVARAGLNVVRVDGVGHYLPIPGRPPVRLGLLDRCRWLTRWTAHHTLVVAEKPGVSA